MNLLSKFLLIAKSCYEQRNFATAMQILGGLEHLAVRQSCVSPRGASGPPRCPRPAPGPVPLAAGAGVTAGAPALPFQAWRMLPAKMAEVMEELKAVEVRPLSRASGSLRPPGPPQRGPRTPGGAQQSLHRGPTAHGPSTTALPVSPRSLSQGTQAPCRASSTGAPGLLPTRQSAGAAARWREVQTG